MKPIAVVNYTEFTGLPLPADAFNSLWQYPTDLLVLQLSKINDLLFNNPGKELNTQIVILQTCFPNLDNVKRRGVVDLLVKHRADRDVAFFTAPTVCKLINLCLQHYKPLPETDEPVNSRELDSNVFDGLLIQNELYYERNPNADLNTHEAIWKLQLLQQHYMRSHPDLLFVAPLKAFLFHKFVMSHLPSGEKFVQEFCESLGIPAYFNYTVWLTEILQKIIHGGQQGEIKYLVELSDEQRKLITLFSINRKEGWHRNIKGNVHAELMMHPFYRLMDKYAIIIDPHFFRYVLDIGLPFQLYSRSSWKKTKPFQDINNFKAELGKRYYEEFVVKGLLGNIFKDRNYVVKDSPENSPLSDFTVVRNQRQILLIEVKSAAIHYNPLEDVDVIAFKDFIDEHFCQQKNRDGKKNKGVYQLARQIIDFAATTKLDCILKNPADKKKITIYPVIVHTDDVMDMAGVSTYLNERLLKEVQAIECPFKAVQPLVVVNLNFLLRYYAHLKQTPSLLFGMLADYAKTVNQHNKAFDKMKNPFLFFEKNVSFDQYAAGKLKGVDCRASFGELVTDLQLLVD